MIAMHCCGSGVVRNSDRADLWVVGLQCANALPVHANSARNQIGVQRQRIAFALFDAGDLSGPLQISQSPFQPGLLISLKSELSKQLANIRWSVAPAMEQL